MKKIVFYVLAVSIVTVACSKELGKNVSLEDQPQISVSLTPDESIDSTGASPDDDNGGGIVDSIPNDSAPDNTQGEINGSDENEHAVYSFMGVSGVYFGCISTFKTKSESLQFILGTNLTTNLAFTQQEFEELIQPGSRDFGSLGAFTSYPERKPGKVEIAYTDKHGRRWCSTRITEKKNGHTTETSVKIEQSQATFVIEDAHKFELSADTEGYRVKGQFSCTLYEVNGDAKKKIKGNFTAVVAPK